MKKFLHLIKRFFTYNPRKKWVDLGLLDYSGQGRNKYGQ